MPAYLTNIVPIFIKRIKNPSVLKNILVLGAGRSSVYLIDYLLQHADIQHWEVTIADLSAEAAAQKAKGHPSARAIAFDLKNNDLLQAEVQRTDVVVSLLPADMHLPVAQACVQHGRSMFTASYVSPGMQALDTDVRAKDLLFLNEIGCDPGIDHMSAMELIDEIKAKGGKITAFYSYTGGLVAPACDTNPWHYKFSWNPRNVVLAGQPGPARYLANGTVRYVPYDRLFNEAARVEVPGFGFLDAYANRDSLPYQSLYGLESAHTLLRATFRYPEYCDAWSVMVYLGLTNEQLQFNHCRQMRYRDLLNACLPPDSTPTVRAGFEKTLREKLHFDAPTVTRIAEQFAYLDFFSERTFSRDQASAAQLLLDILQEKWHLETGDRDLVVMQHRFEYELNGEHKVKTSTLVLEGENDYHTAMAKTVGLPLAMALRRYLLGEVGLRGVQIPIQPEIYKPILTELEEWGVKFHHN